jgi:cytochrome c oxidase accessory protein FixG
VRQNQVASRDAAVDDLYAEAEHWHVNTGGETIHAKRITGTWRTVKWLTATAWLVFFLGPYLRWDNRQAVLFDIPHRQFHIFGATILPQDFWMLSLTLLFFAILLAVVTAMAGRVWCGYFCFQTVWTDVFTWIETRLEGNPQQRRKLDKAPMDFRKFRIKAVKHLLWVLIGSLTGISFVAWFSDAYQLWGELFSFQAGAVTYTAITLFTAGTYVLAGWMREQACFWLCPYARIQGVMVDVTTLLPTYDLHRGEPRGRLKKGAPEGQRTSGDCVDCGQCLAVCPTGVDIRQGQQEGCITCALCIDACNAVMEKVGRPKGLIRYTSLDQLQGKATKPLLKRPRVWVYGGILTIALSGIGVGFSRLNAVELKVLHERAPLFVLQSDGSIQNKYYLKVLNKTSGELRVRINATGPRNLQLIGADQEILAAPEGVTSSTVFIKVPRPDITQETLGVFFHLEAADQEGHAFSYSRKSIFIGPAR